MSREKYVREFCHDRCIRDRRVVYVSESTHTKLKRIASLLREEHQTVVSLADAIITRHIDTYKPLFNRLEEEECQAVLKWLSRKSEPACEDED